MTFLSTMLLGATKPPPAAQPEGYTVVSTRDGYRWFRADGTVSEPYMTERAAWSAATIDSKKGTK